MSDSYDLDKILTFLRVSTPPAWLHMASKNLPLLLVDHAHCERKAAATAINLMSKYPEKIELVLAMSALAREELLHFEKVLDILHARHIPFGPLKPCGYAQHLHQEVTNLDYLERIAEQLIVGAIIEARSCERFHALISILDDSELVKFYRSLVKAEARHFEDYLRLAEHYSKQNLEKRIADFLDIENQMIYAPIQLFRFHGGIPSEAF